MGYSLKSLNLIPTNSSVLKVAFIVCWLVTTTGYVPAVLTATIQSS